MEQENYIPDDFSIEALQKGSEQEFETVFQYYYARILFFVKRLIADHYAAEEITEDVFLKLWQRRMGFESFPKIKAFLYIAARNRCLDYIKVSGRQNLKKEALAYQMSQLEQETEHAIIREEVLSQVSEAIATLPEQCRIIMNYAYEEGLKPKEIARIMDIAVSTVRNQQARGIHILRKKLSGKHLQMLLAILHAGGL